MKEKIEQLLTSGQEDSVQLGIQLAHSQNCLEVLQQFEELANLTNKTLIELFTDPKLTLSNLSNITIPQCIYKLSHLHVIIVSVCDNIVFTKTFNNVHFFYLRRCKNIVFPKSGNVNYNLTQIFISNCLNITNIDSILHNAPNVSYIYMLNNKKLLCNHDFSSFKDLEFLTISKMPNIIKNLKLPQNIERVMLQDNKLKHIPKCLYEVSQLQYISLSDNNIKEVNLSELPNSASINLYSNLIKKVTQTSDIGIRINTVDMRLNPIRTLNNNIIEYSKQKNINIWVSP